MPEPGILVDGLWKRFRRGELHDSLRDLIPAVAKRVAGGKQKTSELGKNEFWALQDLSFEVKAGEALGVIGPNGAGKSTLLKVLNRILRPTAGRVVVTGRVRALIEIAAGFHPDLTGRENIFLQGAIMGMPQAEIRTRFDEIVDFSGISPFIDTPVKRYSSGMNARLGFAIAAHLDPEVLLIDEVLAVGDHSFQARAFDRLREMAQSGVPVVVVSHQLDRISALCKRAILLTGGAVRVSGTAEECIREYTSPEISASAGEEHALSVRELLTDPAEQVGSGEGLKVRFTVSRKAGISNEGLLLGARVRSGQNGKVLFARNFSAQELGLPLKGEFSVDGGLIMNLPFGNYFVEVYFWDEIRRKELPGGASRWIEVTQRLPFYGTVQLSLEMALRAGEQ